MVPWEIKPQIRRRFPTPQKLKTPKKLRLQQCVMLRWRMLLPPEKRNVVSTGHTLQRLGPKWPVMPVFHSTHKKSTFQPKNRPRIGEGVKTSLHTWCIYYIDRVYISRFSKFRGLWQKSKEDIFLVNNKCINTMIILVSPLESGPLPRGTCLQLCKRAPWSTKLWIQVSFKVCRSRENNNKTLYELTI